MKQLILIRGLPGSGKSTLARQLLLVWPNPFWVEADMFFMKGGDYHFDSDKLAEAHRWCQTEANQALHRGKHVIVSNTFSQRWEMNYYIEMARAHNCPLQIIECQGSFPNVHGVPPEKIADMKRRWESPSF